MTFCFELFLLNTILSNYFSKTEMNEIANQFLLAGDKFMSDLLITLVEHLFKIKKGFKNLKKQEIQYIYAEIN